MRRDAREGAEYCGHKWEIPLCEAGFVLGVVLLAGYIWKCSQ
jgi:hypothetical protein